MGKQSKPASVHNRSRGIVSGSSRVVILSKKRWTFSARRTAPAVFARSLRALKAAAAGSIFRGDGQSAREEDSFQTERRRPHSSRTIALKRGIIDIWVRRVSRSADRNPRCAASAAAALCVRF